MSAGKAASDALRPISKRQGLTTTFTTFIFNFLAASTVPSVDPVSAINR